MNIDPSVKIYPLTQIEGNVTIGKNSVIGSYCHILGNVTIGENVRIQSFAFIPSGVTIEDNVFIGPRFTALNDKKPPSKGEHWMPIVIRSGAVIGGNVTILPGVTVERGTLVGAGSVVTKDTPPNSIVLGNPAKVYKNK